jgi:hypothetical protein
VEPTILFVCLVVRWDDVPAVSDDYDRAQAAIDARLAGLVEEYAQEVAS